MLASTNKAIRRKPVNGHDNDSYRTLCHEVTQAVYAGLEPKADIRPDKQFLPDGSARSILKAQERLPRLLSSIHSSKPPHWLTRDVSEEEQIERIESRQLYGLLALLLFTECPQAAVQAFIKKLVLVGNTEWEEENKRRKRNYERGLGVLPLRRDEAARLFGRHEMVTLNRIRSNQPLFSPIYLFKQKETPLNDVGDRRYPYLEEAEFGEGGRSTVFKVKLAIGHVINEDDEANRKAVYAARKDYKLKPEESPEDTITEAGRRIHDENKILPLLNKCRDHKNIVKCLGAFRSETLYSLFLEPAASDLYQYLQSRPQKLTSSAAKGDFLQCAVDVTGGLVWLHEEIKVEGFDKCICYHLDIKLQNVLVFLVDNGAGDKVMIWKLSDFTEAVLKMKNVDDEVRTGPRSWFLLKRENPTFSNTVNPRLDGGTCLPPETRDGQRHMGAHSDVWMWGCVVSMLFAFLEKGYKGVDEYEALRIKDREVYKSDQFFRPPLRWRSRTLNTKVEEYHEQLISEAEARSIVEGRAVKQLLDFLVKQVFVIDWEDRKATARMIKNELQKVRDYYAEPSESTSDSGDGSSDSFWLRALRIINGLKPNIFKPISDESKDDQDCYIIPAYKFVKASTITSCGRIVAFWSDAYIRLYTSDMLKQSTRDRYSISLRGEEFKLERDDAFWNSVDITWKYAVASTNSSNFDCHIFEITDYERPGITMDTSFRASLRLPGIRRVALSPNSEWFACVVRSKGNSKQNGSLVYAPMTALLEIATSRVSIPEEDLEDSDPILDEDETWLSTETDCPAADLISLAISEANIIYAVMLPYTSIIDSEHRIILHSLDIATNEFRTVRLRSTPLEHGTASFFTTFAPFRTTNACAIVTRENRFHIHYFSQESHPNNCVQSIERYRLLEVILDLEEKHIYALGTEPAKHQVLLLKFRVPKSDDDNIQIEMIKRLRNVSYNDDCKLSLSKQDISKQDTEKHIVVSSARGVIYRHQLPVT